jgi:hypothetical protein
MIGGVGGQGAGSDFCFDLLLGSIDACLIFLHTFLPNYFLIFLNTRNRRNIYMLVELAIMRMHLGSGRSNSKAHIQNSHHTSRSSAHFVSDFLLGWFMNTPTGENTSVGMAHHINGSDGGQRLGARREKVTSKGDLPEEKGIQYMSLRPSLRATRVCVWSVCVCIECNSDIGRAYRAG